MRSLLAAVTLLAGCEVIEERHEVNEFSGDPHPIAIDTHTGAVVAGLRMLGEDRLAVIDVMSPFTVIDRGPTVAPEITSSDLVLLGFRPAAAVPDLPRARFADKSVLVLHPCDPEVGVCTVGDATASAGFDAILGAEAIAGDALRMRLGDNQLFVLPDIAGAEEQRDYACDAVFLAPFRGGGTLLVARTEVSFSGRRVALPACLAPDPDGTLPQSQRGADALFVLSTGVGISLLGESAYERYRQVVPAAPPLLALPAASVTLVSGPVAGRLASIDALALVARSESEPRSPCRHYYAHSLLSQRDCEPGEDCPCNDGDVFCSVPASIDLGLGAPIEMLVIPDDNAMLQALRTELRPDQPEVDGILGTDVLRSVELDLDYPHSRALARCTTDACRVHPAFSKRNRRPRVLACMGVDPGPITVTRPTGTRSGPR